MTIKIGKFRAIENNTLVLNNNISPYVIDLNTDTELADKETYVRFGSQIYLGTSNSSFIIKEQSEDVVLFNVNKDTISFNQEVSFADLVVENDTDVSNINIRGSLNTSGDINLSDSILISPENVSVSFPCTFGSNVIVNDKMFVKEISSIDPNSNLLIKNLKLENFEQTFGIFKEGISISPEENNQDTITVLQKEGSNNYINLKNEDNSVFVINNKGDLCIGSQPTERAKITLSDYSDVDIFHSSNLFINRDGHISLGVKKGYENIIDYETLIRRENNSHLHIHRLDENEQHSILQDPLINLTMDYVEENNHITSNYSRVPFTFSPFMKTSITPNAYHIHLDMLPSNEDTKIWYKSEHISQFILAEKDDNKEFYLNNYDYGYYKLTGYDTTATRYSDQYIGSNVNLFIGFYHDSNISEIVEADNPFEKLIQTIDDAEVQVPTGYEYIKFSCNNYSIFDSDQSSVEFDINIHVLIEERSSSEEIFIEYIDIEPLVIPAPNFLHFESNNVPILDVTSDGLIRTNDLHILNVATMKDVIIDNLQSDINLSGFDISNVSNFHGTSIHADQIFIGNVVKISNENGLEFLDTDVEVVNHITSVDISNITSEFLKYNSNSTSILNELNVCSSLNEIDLKRRAHNIDHDLLVIGKGIHVDGEFDLIGEIHLSNFIIKSEDITDYQIDDDEMLALSFRDNNVTYQRFVDSNIVLGDNGFVTMSSLNNRISIGVPNEMIDNRFNTEIEIDGWYKNHEKIMKMYDSVYMDFHTLTNNSEIDVYNSNTVLTVFGSSRFADKNNATLMEIREYSTNDNDKYTLNLFGNLKCSRRLFYDNTGLNTDENRIALDVSGDVIVDGKVEATQGVASVSDRRLKTDLTLITESLDKVKQLSGYTFDRNDINIRDTGLIAQDVQKILPEAVHENNDGYLSISYGKLAGLLVESIKELDKKMNSLLELHNLK